MKENIKKKCPKCNKSIKNLECVEHCFIDYDVFAIDDFDEIERETIAYRFICPKCKKKIFTTLKEVKKWFGGKI